MNVKFSVTHGTSALTNGEIRFQQYANNSGYSTCLKLRPPNYPNSNDADLTVTGVRTLYTGNLGVDPAGNKTVNVLLQEPITIYKVIMMYSSHNNNNRYFFGVNNGSSPILVYGFSYASADSTSSALQMNIYVGSDSKNTYTAGTAKTQGLGVTLEAHLTNYRPVNVSAIYGFC